MPPVQGITAPVLRSSHSGGTVPDEIKVITAPVLRSPDSDRTERDEIKVKNAVRLREALATRLEQEHQPELAAKLLKCGSPLQLTCTCCGETKTTEERCKQRWCPVCAIAISVKRIARFNSAAARCQWPLMVTLTTTNTSDAQEAVSKIVKAFTKFRRQKFWNRTVKGGVASFECTNRGNGWHPHLHVLCDCRWLALATPEPKRRESIERQRDKLRSAQRELSQEWAACLDQETSIVHARRAFGPMLKEALKYNLKPSELAECEEPIGPLLWALKGKRLVIPFGSFYDLGEEWKKHDNETKWQSECSSCKAQGTWMPTAITNFISRPGVKNSKWHRTQ